MASVLRMTLRKTILSLAFLASLDHGRRVHKCAKRGQPPVETWDPREALAKFLTAFSPVVRPVYRKSSARGARCQGVLAMQLIDSGRTGSCFELFSKPQPPVTRVRLPIKGNLPAELAGGSYLRNGGNFARGESDSVLSFDGHGFIHRVAFGAEYANYSSEFVRTDAWELEEELGRPVPRLSPRGIAEALRRNVRLGRANTNVLAWGAGLWAFEESDAPVEIALRENGLGLSTVSNDVKSLHNGIQETAMRKLVSQLRAEKLAFTGHPTKIIDRGGSPLLVGYGYSHEARWPLSVYTVSANETEPSSRMLEGTLEGGLWGTGWQRPITIHNAAASRHALFIPISIAPLGSPEWIRVPLPLRDSQPITTLQSSRARGFIGECIGAYRQSNTSQEEVFAFVHPPESPYAARLFRFTVHGNKLVDEDVLWPERLFMCGCASPSPTGEPPRFIFALARSQDSVEAGRTDMSGIDALVKLDLVTGESLEIRASDGNAEVCFGEPCFVPAAEAATEDDGFLLALRSDGITGTTALHVFNASSFSHKPLATVELGVPVPHGAHGCFVPGMLS